MVLLDREPEAYAPAARRLISRLAAERPLALRRLADIAALLAELQGDPDHERRGRLVRLIGEAPRS